MPGSKPGALPLGDIPTKNYWNLNPARLPIPPLPHRLYNKVQVVILNSSLSCNLTLAEPFLKEEMVAKTGFEPVTPSL